MNYLKELKFVAVSVAVSRSDMHLRVNDVYIYFQNFFSHTTPRNPCETRTTLRKTRAALAINPQWLIASWPASLPGTTAYRQIKLRNSMTFLV